MTTETLFAAVAQVHAQNRKPVRWVMGCDAWRQVRKLSVTYAPHRPGPQSSLLGLPIVVDEEAGAGFGLVVR
jgi:hypothetical protein